MKITREKGIRIVKSDSLEIGEVVRDGRGIYGMVQVQAKFSTKYGKHLAISPWNCCVCEFVSEGLDDEGSALIGAHILEPLRGETGGES